MTENNIEDAIRSNNTVKVDGILNEFCPLSENGLRLTSKGARVASVMLKTASAMAYYDALDDSLAYALIERLGMAINIFALMQRLVVTEDADNHLAEIPVKILTALHQNEYSDDVISELHDLRDKTTFKAILACIVGRDEINRLDHRFATPFIREIYARKIVPAYLLFRWMNEGLRNPASDTPGIVEVFATVLTPSVIDSILFGPSGDDDE